MTGMNPDYPFGPQQPQPQPPMQPVQSVVPPTANSNYIIPPRKQSKKWVIMTIVFITTTVIALAVLAWALINYFDQKNNVDTKVSSAVTIAVKEQADEDAAAFLEKEKQPNRQFVGPEDYGQLAFDYPKTWSIYVDKDATSGDSYVAYFNPVSVPAVSNSQQYALRLTIESKDYDQVLSSYNNLVTRNDLTASAVKVNGEDGTQFTGNFTKDIRGSAVVFKIRDKTVTLRSDADTFKGDFDALIQTITFNK